MSEKVGRVDSMVVRYSRPKPPVKDRREGWLRELVVGDRVIVNSHGQGLEYMWVRRLTPTGFIVVGTKYDKRRDSFSPKGWLGDHTELQEPTSELDRLTKAHMLARDFPKRMNVSYVTSGTTEADVRRQYERVKAWVFDVRAAELFEGEE